jgi:hypothetical protein
VIRTTGPKYFWPIALHISGSEIGNPAEKAAPVCSACSSDSTQGERSDQFDVLPLRRQILEIERRVDELEGLRLDAARRQGLEARTRRH